MQVSLEFLFHYRCDHCNKWFSVADILPKFGTQMCCIHCGRWSMVGDYKTMENQKAIIECLKKTL